MNKSDRPIWPALPDDDPPKNDEIVAHNLAVIAQGLSVVAERLENITALLERVSGHLYDLKTGRRA